MLNWRCESLRLTAFWLDGRDPSDLLTWEAITGSVPDHDERQPKTRTSRQVGPLPDSTAMLEMRASVGRVDWFYTNVVTALVDLRSPFEGFMPLDGALAAFTKLVFPKACEAYDAVRFALGVAVVHPTKSQQGSYHDLSKLLPDINVPEENANEFFFQINRPRPSAVIAGMEINRLSRWMAIAAGQFVSPIISVAPVRVLSDAPYATRVELDISTPAESQSAIPLEFREPVLNEMLQQAEEILEKGDLK